MKKLSAIKKVQLFVLVLLSVGSLAAVFADHNLFNYIASNRMAMFLYGMLWVIIVASFLFLYIDFSSLYKLKKDYKNMHDAAYSDPLSGIPNRFSLDMLLETYAGKTAPDNIGCAMIDLTNLFEVNRLYGHQVGNELLKAFSNILYTASASLCFIGRNSGNKFLAIFEECTREHVEQFLDRTKKHVEEYNQDPEHTPIVYKTGVALNMDEHAAELTELISLSNKRVSGSE